MQLGKQVSDQSIELKTPSAAPTKRQQVVTVVSYALLAGFLFAITLFTSVFSLIKGSFWMCAGFGIATLFVGMRLDTLYKCLLESVSSD